LPETYSFAPIGWQGILLRLGIALVVGAVIGLERETKSKPAGLRTNMLVSFGSALMVLVPIEIGAAQQNLDVLGRAISGVISGVGFIGGGTILRESRVKADKKMNIIAWLVLGLIAGALAKLIYPGHQGGGIISTIALGILGALVGGFLGQILLGSAGAAAASTGALTIPGIIFAVLGAMLLIFIWGLLTRQTS
jgi:putative Mg2+ transporter-C (MgtC) family protein